VHGIASKEKYKEGIQIVITSHLPNLKDRDRIAMGRN
jgi:hypothetical protein